MDNKGKPKSFTISDQMKVNILVQVDAYIAELASCLRLSVSSDPETVEDRKNC